MPGSGEQQQRRLLLPLLGGTLHLDARVLTAHRDPDDEEELQSLYQGTLAWLSFGAHTPAPVHVVGVGALVHTAAAQAHNVDLLAPAPHFAHEERTEEVQERA